MKQLLTAILITAVSSGLFAQEELLDLLKKSDDGGKVPVLATFLSSRVMNGHSTERAPAGQFDFRVSHRFGKVNSGFSEFFGLDQANMHLGLEYGITDWLMVGMGRGSWEKTFDGFAKFSILRQSAGAGAMPVSLSYFSSLAIRTIGLPQPPGSGYFAARTAFVNQILVARKFSQLFSFQLTPTWLHRDLYDAGTDPADILAIGTGGRIRLAKRVSLNAEYYILTDPRTYRNELVKNPLTIGFDIETGGHVFQLLFSNSLSMIEKGFIGETTGSWRDGDIHFGFNILRVFTLK